MESNWEDIKWIFEHDGGLRDIYIKDVNIEDWELLIDFLNENYKIKYGTTQNNLDYNIIDIQYVLQFLSNQSIEMEHKTASIILDKVIINTHFFADNQIEFDIAPKEINSPSNYKKIINFMLDLSHLLKKEVILTGEMQIDFPLITVDCKNNLVKTLTEKEARKLW